MKKILLLCVCLCLTCIGWAQSYQLSSPDKKIQLNFYLDNGNPFYEVLVDNQNFINRSPMGFRLADGVNLKDKFIFSSVDYDEKDEIWTQIWGQNKQNRNHYREMLVVLKGEDEISLIIDFRVFDDGVAFRYEADAPYADSLFILDELSAFNLADDGKSWSIPANFESYEFLYRTLPISQVENANTPFTFKLKNGLYGSIHEAALVNFPEMTLKHTENCSFCSELAPLPDGIKAKLTNGHFVSPWRTVQIGRKAVDLINSSLILNLNEPCLLQSDLSWIKPMKYIGIWWGMHLGIQTWKMDERHGATTDNAKKYIDFAAANQIDAVLFEGWNEGWESWGGMQQFDFTKAYADFDMEEVLRYANQKNVAFISHHETGGNIFNYERQLGKTYQWLAERDIHCVKTGYAGGIPQGHLHHDQFNVCHYQKVVDTAAKYHCMLNVHEPIKPTGLHRTYPNLMTGEGARGMEWNAWSAGNPPEHHEILPFARLLAGPMDYTPGTFDILYENTRNLPQRQKWNDQDQGNSRVNTTLSKQLANWVILYSPLQMASDLIGNYENHPAFQFFRDFNPDCDWSKALQGEIGELVVMVRRASDTFSLTATTNETQRRRDVPLDFLADGKTYKAVIYADGPDADWKSNPTSYIISEKQSLTKQDVLKMKLASGGGQAVILLPQ
ncbi:MAG: glycoside hydrolase family 97 protein [Bacteroidales bacterium]|nr:glycoside hydrolase family 97 protein [Bacteroidales bacterium]